MCGWPLASSPQHRRRRSIVDQNIVPFASGSSSLGAICDSPSSSTLQLQVLLVSFVHGFHQPVKHVLGHFEMWSCFVDDVVIHTGENGGFEDLDTFDACPLAPGTLQCHDLKPDLPD
jgi:hypothetical protein